MTNEQNPNFKAPELGAPNAAAYYVDHRPGSGAPPFAVKTKEQCAFPDIAEPVYSHPANVAELEARIAALETAIHAACDRLSAPAHTICTSTHCERSSECRSPSDCGGTGKPGAIRILRSALMREKNNGTA